MNKKATALFFSCIVIVILVILGSSILSRSIAESRLAQRNLEFTQAFWLAEAGMQRALRSLNDNDWLGWQDIAANTKTITGSLSLGSYQVQVSGVDTANPLVVTTGNIGALARVLNGAIDSASGSLFTHAAFAKTALAMTGNGETDSYDSSQGAYGGQNVGSNGDVGTNGVTAGAISLTGNATVNGDAETGPEGTVELSGNAEVNGEISHNSDKDLPSVSVPSELSSLAGSGSYSVSGNNSQTISAGDYQYSSINVAGNGKLYIEGTVNFYLTANSSLNIAGNGKMVLKPGAQLTIYADGKSDIAGNGIVNNTNLPQNCLLYSIYSGSGEAVKIAGNGDFYGAIYAPDAEVKVSGNGDIYGALVGEEVFIPGNGNVHYDEALGQLETSTPVYTVGTWREQQNPYPLSP